LGPATIADVAKWSRVSGLRPVVGSLRPRLRTFRDESGRELFDVPGAPLADPDTPAPPRFLPELPAGNGARAGSFLVDGWLRGTWRLEDGDLRLEPFTPLTKREANALDDEAERPRAFLAG
jgi:Winged helix DNA-binding domain